MKNLILFRSLILLVGLSIHLSCNSEEEKGITYPPTDLEQAALIPKPLHMEATQDAFGLDKNTVLFIDNDPVEFREVGRFLSEKIADVTSLEIPLKPTEPLITKRGIFIVKSEDTLYDSPEAYKLKISRDSILLEAHTPEGAFRGVQTIRQLLPNYANDTLAEHPIWPIPTGLIRDKPSLEYRGAMLDVARHFFTVDEVKKYIDALAYYKYNTFHIHLTDDQGWRIEIKSWPKLTEVGGQTEVGGESGGFYTQEEYMELVEYAAKHYITVVPEIDMPGHTNAASVAYPELNGNGKKPELYEGTKVGFSTWDTRKENVYKFIDEVIAELVTMTPGPYIHIGGDESHATKKNDYVYFIEKVEKIVEKHGKTMIGWDEIATANVSKNSIAQFWASEENATEAVKKGLKVIMSPAKKAYLDMQYDPSSKHGLHWAAYIPVDSAYTWSPVTYSANIPREHILGIEAPLWSETISNSEELEYLAFPRAIGFAELGWTPDENRNWEDYSNRLARQLPYLQRTNIAYYPSDKVDWELGELELTPKETEDE
ncbi:MAG: family 20 glycosylhydrolase [Flavobacteriaceae bacterium]|nr:family 20 glycosylhydrolase [Flavobacteriaceae bacterium]